MLSNDILYWRAALHRYQFLCVIPENYWSIWIPICLAEVTWQQASNHINKSIFCGTVSMYRSQCIAVSGVKGRGRKILKFLIKAFLDVTQFQLVKSNFPQENIVYNCRIQHRKNNGFLFTKRGKICLLYQILTIYF